MPRFYHRTDAKSAAEISRSGFNDAVRTDQDGKPHLGVWISNEPHRSRNHPGPTLVEIELTEKAVSLLGTCEWHTEISGVPIRYGLRRHYLAPAALLNVCGRTTLIAQTTED